MYHLSRDGGLRIKMGTKVRIMLIVVLLYPDWNKAIRYYYDKELSYC
jgi:hypothetical protein